MPYKFIEPSRITWDENEIVVQFEIETIIKEQLDSLILTIQQRCADVVKENYKPDTKKLLVNSHIDILEHDFSATSINVEGNTIKSNNNQLVIENYIYNQENLLLAKGNYTFLVNQANN